MTLLTLKDVKVEVEGQEILHGLTLAIKPGEIHFVMGPNGSGKSTLASTLMGHPKYKATGGSASFRTKSLLNMPVEERAALGMFLAFQYPREIPGVNLVSFLRAAYNAVHKARDQKFEPVPLYHFKKMVGEKMDLLKLPRSFMNRNVNEGFSGGEKKKFEMLQMAILEPQLAILDEMDSGLDIDALKTLADALMAFKKPEQSWLIITHYERLLKTITPDHVHIMIDGRIVKSGGHELAEELLREGFEKFRPSSLKVLQ